MIASCNWYILSVCVQIFARFMLSSAPSWTEEASRLLFIYAICFAAGKALEEKYFVNLDLFYNMMPEKLRKWIDIGTSLVLLVLFALTTIYTFPLIKLGFAETSPSLDIPMSIAFLSILIFSVSSFYYSFFELKEKFKKVSQ